MLSFSSTPVMTFKRHCFPLPEVFVAITFSPSALLLSTGCFKELFHFSLVVMEREGHVSNAAASAQACRQCEITEKS